MLISRRAQSRHFRGPEVNRPRFPENTLQPTQQCRHFRALSSKYCPETSQVQVHFIGQAVSVRGCDSCCQGVHREVHGHQAGRSASVWRAHVQMSLGKTQCLPPSMMRVLACLCSRNCVFRSGQLVIFHLVFLLYFPARLTPRLRVIRPIYGPSITAKDLCSDMYPLSAPFPIPPLAIVTCEELQPCLKAKPTSASVRVPGCHQVKS